MPRWTNPGRRLRKKRRKEQVYNEQQRKPYLFIAIGDDEEYGF